MLIDTHVHLDASEFAADRAALMAAARSVGVGAFVVPGVEAAGFAALAALGRACPAVRCAFGIHPLSVDRAAEADLAVLAGWLATGQAVAVGEIGLDGFVPQPDLARQTVFFMAQLKLARRFDLPVILHVRRAQDLVLKGLRQVGVRGGIAHAFNGSRQQADAFLRLGFKLGFGGALTYAGSHRIRALAASLPLDAIVLETDAPDMAPSWAAGERNVPAHLGRIAETLAALRGISLEALAQATSANAREALGLD